MSVYDREVSNPLLPERFFASGKNIPCSRSAIRIGQPDYVARSLAPGQPYTKMDGYTGTMAQCRTGLAAAAASAQGTHV